MALRYKTLYHILVKLLDYVSCVKGLIPLNPQCEVCCKITPEINVIRGLATQHWLPNYIIVSNKEAYFTSFTLARFNLYFLLQTERNSSNYELVHKAT